MSSRRKQSKPIGLIESQASESKIETSSNALIKSTDVNVDTISEDKNECNDSVPITPIIDKTLEKLPIENEVQVSLNFFC